MFVKIVNNTPSEWPVSDVRIRHDNPSVSFPKDMSLIDVTSYGFAPFEYADRPEHNSEYQNCTEIEPVLTNGIYVQTWRIEDKYTAEERTAYDAQKEIDRIANLYIENTQIRHSRLQETDWWAVSDRTMTPEQISYRQALRDITLHENWPDLEEADWPVKP